MNDVTSPSSPVITGHSGNEVVIDHSSGHVAPITGCIREQRLTMHEEQAGELAASMRVSLVLSLSTPL